MRKWTRAVFMVVSSVVLAACGGMEGVEEPSVDQQEAAVKEGPTESFYVCGDYSCDPGEPTSCPEDCPYGGGYCGDGVCGSGETRYNCSSDCYSGCLAAPKEEEPPTESFYVCGDYSCDPGEPTSCPEDCPYGGGYCGDGVCGSGETRYNCSSDCYGC
jgi:hypothetical protein